jgi:hypothetical protein
MIQDVGTKGRDVQVSALYLRSPACHSFDANNQIVPNRIQYR